MTHTKNKDYEIQFNGIHFIAITESFTKDGFRTANEAILYVLSKI